MICYVTIQENKITEKFSVSFPLIEIGSNQSFIARELFDKITHTPADFTLGVDGEIIDVTPVEKPIVEPEPAKPTELELLQAKVAQQDAVIQELMFEIIPQLML